MQIIIKKISSKKTGPSVAVIGGVHGNEIVGVKIIRKLMDELVIQKGSVFLVIANPKAISLNKRFIDNDLNRSCNEKIVGVSNENLIAKEIIDLIKKVDIVIDLHSFRNKISKPFTICDINELELAQSILGIDTISIGWDKIHKGSTDGFARSIGKKAICFELGSNHLSEKYEQFGIDIVKQCLSYFSLIQYKTTQKIIPKRIIEITKVITSTASFTWNIKYPQYYFNLINSKTSIANSKDKKYFVEKNEYIVCPENKISKPGYVYILGKKYARK